MAEIMNLMRNEEEEDEDLSKDQHSGASYLGRQGLGQTQRARQGTASAVRVQLRASALAAEALRG